jgi:ARG and Rhodanese-Phosphatase-superfamily-associated Protein domain
MRSISVAPLAVALALVGASGGAALADQGMRVSGPFVHGNLAIYLVHGASVAGPVPLTLQEAVAKGQVQVSETGRVNELEIENTGSESVFIQAGDIVKGGRQDRVLTVSFLLPANSGRLPIASYCVEQGRWTARGTEDQKRFSSAGEAMPSRSALLAMAAPPAPKEPSQPEAGLNPSGGNAALSQRVAREVDEVATKQRQVWDSVATTQRKLSQGLNAPVASPQSASSLQLALENEKLKGAQAAFMAALLPAGEKDADVVGYVVAINARMSSANLYPSNALFRKMWGKQLAAAITEAIGEAGGSAPTATPPPAPAAATQFLADAEKGKSYQRPVAAGTLQEIRDADKFLYNEARAADGQWVHRNYLAK